MRVLVGFIALLCSGSVLAGLADPESGKMVIWPNIPLISASDFEEYKLDRDIFRGLHLGEQDPAKVKTALKQVDKLYEHHKARATDRLGRTYNTDLIGHFDRLIKEQQIITPRLEFSFNEITPVGLSEDIDLKSEPLEALKGREDVIGVIGYVTTTKMSLKQLRATLTLIQLKNGISRSFTVTDQAHKIATRHAQQLFDYIYGPSYPEYRNPLQEMVWLMPAPTDQERQVSRMQAELACRSQRAVLPTVDELMLGEQAGPYHHGIILKPGQFYHAAGDKRYLAGETGDPRGKIRLLHSSQQRARYYCIQQAPQPIESPPLAAVAQVAPEKVETPAATEKKEKQ